MVQVRVLIPEAVVNRIDELAARLPLVGGRSPAHVRGALVREAVEAGLTALEADPAALVRPRPTANKESK